MAIPRHRIPSPDYWFAGGDLLILKAITPNQDLVYRVHSHLLFDNAPDCVFYHMNGEVSMRIGEKDEVTSLLLDLMYKDWPFAPLPTIQLLDQILEFCARYNASAIRVKIIRHYQTVLGAPSLNDWDAAEINYEKFRQRHLAAFGNGLSDGNFLDIYYRQQEPVAFIKLVRKHKLGSTLLPPLYSQLLRTPREANTAYAMQPDDTLKYTTCLELLSKGVRTAEWSQLTEMDRFIMTEFRTYQSGLFQGGLPPIHPSHVKCNNIRDSIYVVLRKEAGKPESDQLTLILRLIAQISGGEGFCSECMLATKGHLHRLRSLLWEAVTIITEASTTIMHKVA